MAMGEAIVITSGKGGVGKTTVCLNIGAALATRGKRVVLVDTDLGLRNLDVVMGLEDKIVFDLVDVVEGRCRLKQALVQDVRFSGRLSLLPAAQTRDKDTVNIAQMRVLCNELRELFDYVLIDCPAGIEQGFRNAVAGADQAIVVSMPEISAVRDADRVIGLLMAYDIPSPKLVLNRLHPRLMRKGDMMSISDTSEVLGIPLLGVVPNEDQVIRSGNLGTPVALSQSRAAQAFQNIASRILGQEVPLMKLENPSRVALARLFGVIG
jgi:septum site-determining protein MinD